MKSKQKNPINTLETILVIGPMEINYQSLKERLIGIDANVAVFFLDAGIRHKKKLENLKLKNLCFSFSFGDGDGASLFQNDMHKDDQNLSDLSFFCQWAYKIHELKSILFYGMSGGRLDHMLSNVGEINHFLNKRIKAKRKNINIELDSFIEFLSQGIHKREIYGPFSLMSVAENLVKLTGKCEFKLLKPTPLFPFSSQTLSNIGHGMVKIEANKPLMIIKSPEL